MSYVSPNGNAINFNLIGQYSAPDQDKINFNLREVIGQVFSDILLNIGTNVLDVWYDGCYILTCTNSGVECLNSKTFESIWYFNTTVVQAVCSNQEIVCFGTICSGVYYNDFPKTIGDAGNFLASCNIVNNLTSSGITDICVSLLGFFVGGDDGVDVLTTNSGLNLEVTCQLTCSGVNSVAYSVNTETYYWSTASKAYYADTCVSEGLVVKSTATPGYTINSINVEYLNGEDVLYVSTSNGIIKVFSPSCSGTILDVGIVASDYASGSCTSGIIYAGKGDDLLEVDIFSDTFETFFVGGEIVEVLYYSW